MTLFTGKVAGEISSIVRPKIIKNDRRAYSTRKTPLYCNSQILAPDGEPLCVCDPTKAYWYVRKGLGDLLSEVPLVVKLRFEPAGRPIKEGKDGLFYLQDRANICVVCGVSESYIRKNIVPKDYRKHFPSMLKSHQSHDVVLLCVDCHQQSNIKDNELRCKLAEEFDAPIGQDSDIKASFDIDLKAIKSAGGALLRNSKQLPEKRKIELEDKLKQYYKTDTLTEEHIVEAADLDITILNLDYAPHGYKVYQAYKKIGLIHLERRWRQWFLDTMNPGFMPENWSLSHNQEKLKVKMARYPLDDPIRHDYKEALVGTEGSIDVPYVPGDRKKVENFMGLDPIETSSREDSSD